MPGSHQSSLLSVTDLVSESVSEWVTDKHCQWSDSGPIKKTKKTKSPQMAGGTNDAVTQNQSACKPKFSLQWFHTKSLLTHSVNLCTMEMLTLSQWKQMQTFLPPVKDPHNSFTNWLNIKSYYNWTISLLSQRMKEVEIQGLLWWDLMQQIQSIRWSIEENKIRPV